MHFNTVVLALAGISACQAAYIPSIWARDDDAVKNDFGNVLPNDISKFKAALDAWTGSILTAGDIISTGTQLSTDVNSTTTDVNAITGLFDTDLSSYVAGQTTIVAQSVEDTLTSLINQEPNFSAAGINSLVLQQLEGLNAEFEAFSGALMAHAASDADNSTFKAAHDGINTQYLAAVQAFSTSS